MTHSLLLRLAGPLQAWGAGSRFVHRTTEIAPTKSGVLGMLAAAQGIRRTEPLTELLGLSFAVRIDQPGQVLRDFQTALPPNEPQTKLSYRYYLSDAVFVAAIGGDEDLLHRLHAALRRPHFALYLGRRSCPPIPPVSLGVHPAAPATILCRHAWQASPWYRRTWRQPTVTLEILRDAEVTDPTSETIRDQPVTFDPTHREHGWRLVVRQTTEVANPPDTVPSHDPMTALGG